MPRSIRARTAADGSSRRLCLSALLGLAVAVTAGLLLSGCSLASATGDAVQSGQHAVAQAGCNGGDLAVGEKKTVTDSSKQKVLITGGRCFDHINTPATLLTLSEADNKRVNATFCSKLEIEPQLNTALGHGISSSSTLSLIPRTEEGSGLRGLCTWSEDYLALKDAPGVPYWREVSVSYSLNDAQLRSEYLGEQDTLIAADGMTTKKRSDIGEAALEYTGSTKPEAHGILAMDGKGATVWVTANNKDVTDLLPDIARKSLALAAKLKDDPSASPTAAPSGATKEQPVALGTTRQIGEYSVTVHSFTLRDDGSEEADWTVTYTGETQGSTGSINLWFMADGSALGDQGCTGEKPETQTLEANVPLERQSCAPLSGASFDGTAFVFTAGQPENFWAQM